MTGNRKASDLIEGLYLTYIDEVAVIQDTQDVEWIRFTRGGNGDVPDWPAAVIRDTCHALGVTTAIRHNNDSSTGVEECSVEDFIAWLMAPEAYAIVETVTYEVSARSPEEALEKFVNADNINDYIRCVDDRRVLDSANTDVTPDA